MSACCDSGTHVHALISFLQTNEDDLRYKFERYGKLMDVYIPREPGSNRPRGFGFVTYHDRRDAEDGCAEMDGCALLLHCNVFVASLTCFVQTTDASCRAVLLPSISHAPALPWAPRPPSAEVLIPFSIHLQRVTFSASLQAHLRATVVEAVRSAVTSAEACALADRAAASSTRDLSMCILTLFARLVHHSLSPFSFSCLHQSRSVRSAGVIALYHTPTYPCM